MVDMVDYSEDEFNLRIKNITFNKSNNTIVIQFETGYMLIVPIASIEEFN